MLSGTSTKKIYLYNCLTLGLYFFYWCSHSRQDINQSARQKLIPTTWLLALPGGNYWWMWRYAEALEFVSFRRLKRADTCLLYIIGSHAFLLLTFGIQPTLNIGNNDQSGVSNTVLIIILAYIGLCIVLEILGAAFFCATMQKKINALRTPSTTGTPQA